MVDYAMGLTFRFKYDSYDKQNEKMVKDFVREMIKEEGFQLGYIGVLVTVPNQHGHFAITSDKKNEEKFLQINKRKWRERWAVMTGQSINSLIIEDIDDNKGWIGYMNKNIRSDVDHTTVWYNKKMLARREHDEKQ